MWWGLTGGNEFRALTSDLKLDTQSADISAEDMIRETIVLVNIKDL